MAGHLCMENLKWAKVAFLAKLYDINHDVIHTIMLLNKALLERWKKRKTLIFTLGIVCKSFILSLTENMPMQMYQEKKKNA